jgi:hypothetical protein
MHPLKVLCLLKFLYGRLGDEETIESEIGCSSLAHYAFRGGYSAID